MKSTLKSGKRKDEEGRKDHTPCHSNVDEREQTEAGSRKRLPWSKEEIIALKDGLRVYDKNHRNRFAAILQDPRFGPTLARRTNVDLKDKYRGGFRAQKVIRMSNARPITESGSRKRIEWSVKECKKLLEGVDKYRRDDTVQWAQILRDPKFRLLARRRASLDLRDKLRNLMKNSEELALKYAGVV